MTTKIKMSLEAQNHEKALAKLGEARRALSDALHWVHGLDHTAILLAMVFTDSIRSSLAERTQWSEREVEIPSSPGYPPS